MLDDIIWDLFCFGVLTVGEEFISQFHNYLRAAFFLIFFRQKTFYARFFWRYPFAKKSKSRIVIREKLHNSLSYKKLARKMLPKLTPNGTKVNIQSRKVGLNTKYYLPRLQLWRLNYNLVVDGLFSPNTLKILG